MNCATVGRTGSTTPHECSIHSGAVAASGLALVWFGPGRMAVVAWLWDGARGWGTIEAGMSPALTAGGVVVIL